MSVFVVDDDGYDNDITIINDLFLIHNKTTTNNVFLDDDYDTSANKDTMLVDIDDDKFLTNESDVSLFIRPQKRKAFFKKIGCSWSFQNTLRCSLGN